MTPFLDMFLEGLPSILVIIGMGLLFCITFMALMDKYFFPHFYGDVIKGDGVK